MYHVATVVFSPCAVFKYLEASLVVCLWRAAEAGPKGGTRESYDVQLVVTNSFFDQKPRLKWWPSWDHFKRHWYPTVSISIHSWLMLIDADWSSSVMIGVPLWTSLGSEIPITSGGNYIPGGDVIKYFLAIRLHVTRKAACHHSPSGRSASRTLEHT